MKKILWLLSISIALSTFAVEFFMPFYAIFVQQIGGSIVLAGGTWAIYKLGSAVVMLFSGKLSDKFKAENMMVIGFSLRVIGTAGYFFVDSPTKLLFVQLIHGVAHALILPSYRKLYSEHLDKGKEAREWSYTLSIDEVITAGAVFFGGLVLDRLGFFSVFGVMLVAQSFAFINAVMVKFYIERKPSKVPKLETEPVTIDNSPQ